MAGTGFTAEANVTRGLPSYHANPWIADADRRQRFVAFTDPAPDDCVLDVASGPGFNAFAFARRCKRVIAIDDCELALIRAEALRAEERLSQIEFMVGEATDIPFDNGLFDIVTCSIVLHHFESPEAVLREMTRVCRPSGKLAIEDLVVPDDPAGAEHRDTLESLRDPSHKRFLSAAELRGLLDGLGVQIDREEIETSERRLSEWLSVTRPDREVAADCRRRLLDRDLSERAELGVRAVEDDLVFQQAIWRFVASKPAG